MYVLELGQMVGVGVTIGVGVVAGVGVSVTVTVLVIVMISHNSKKGDAICANSLFKQKEGKKVFCCSMFVRENDIMLLEMFVIVPCTVIMKKKSLYTKRYFKQTYL